MDERRAAAERICRVLSESGYRALFAGGCVRDLLLGVPPKDYDIATDAPPLCVAELFERTVNVGIPFGVQIVLLPEGQFEVATFREDGPYFDGRRPIAVEFSGEVEDARRRDFTINAMYYDPREDCIVDYVGGREDLRRGIVRAVGDPFERFQEDHLRLLRAIRFAARLGFVIEDQTAAALREMAPFILKTSAERIRDEILKILTEGAAKQGFELLDETGLLGHVLPEVARTKGVEQPLPYHPEGDVFTHTLLMLDEMSAPSMTLALGVLLHDVGKPLTQSFEDRIRFNNHDKAGEEAAREICKRLRLPGDAAKRVVWLVAQHMRIGVALDMRPARLKRFAREEGFTELLELFRLDCIASHEDLEVYNRIRAYLAELRPEEVKPPPLLTGHDLIAMGYRPGPQFSEILHAVEDAQLEGRVENAEGARELVRAQWPAPIGPADATPIRRQ